MVMYAISYTKSNCRWIKIKVYYWPDIPYIRESVKKEIGVGDIIML